LTDEKTAPSRRGRSSAQASSQRFVVSPKTLNLHDNSREDFTLKPIRFLHSSACPYRWTTLFCSIVIVALISLSAGLAQPTSADVGPEGDWVPTGPPATPANILTLGTLVTLPNGTPLLIGTLVQRYVLATGEWLPAGSLRGNGGVPTVLANGKVL